MENIDYKTMYGKPGIYCIENTLNHKKYIGSSKNIYNRLHYHMCKLKYQRGHNKHLQNSYNKYGDVFKAYVLFYCNEKDRLIFEQHVLEQYKPEYNKSFNVRGSLGTKLTYQRKKQISNTLKQKYKSGEIKTYRQNHNWKNIYVYNIFTLERFVFKNRVELNKFFGKTGKSSYKELENKLMNKKFYVSLTDYNENDLKDKIKQKINSYSKNYKINLPF